MHKIDVSVLVGAKIIGYSLSDAKETLLFALHGGEFCEMGHEPDCCEKGYLAEVHGDLDDLVGRPLLQAEMVGTKSEDADDTVSDGCRDWTFYKLATDRGAVTLRWVVESNGHYSTAIDVWILTKDNVKPELLQRWSWSPKTLWDSLKEGGQ